MLFYYRVALERHRRRRRSAPWKGWLMVSRIVVLLLIIFVSLPSSTFATNWVYLQRLEGTRDGPCTEYIDTDSVIKEDNKLVYWTIWVLDETLDYDGTKKILFKKEAPLVYPLRQRNLEIYRYDSEDVEIRRDDLKQMNFYYMEAQDEINRALQYANAAANGSAQPDHSASPTPRWYGYIELDDCKLYWNIRSITAWPQDSPTTVDIIIKFVWNMEGLAKREAYLKAKRPYGYRGDYDCLSYTLVNYRFLLTENRMRILSEVDYDTDNQRMTLLDGTDWCDIEKGSKNDLARKIALNWLISYEAPVPLPRQNPCQLGSAPYSKDTLFSSQQ